MGSLERRCLKKCVGGRPLYDGEVGLFLVSSSQDNICESRLHDRKRASSTAKKCTTIIPWESMYFSKLNISLSIDFPFPF